MFNLLISCWILLVKSQWINFNNYGSPDLLKLSITGLTSQYTFDAITILFPQKYQFSISEQYVCSDGNAFQCSANILSGNQIQITQLQKKGSNQASVNPITVISLDHDNLYGTINLYSNGDLVETYTADILYQFRLLTLNSYTYLSNYTYTKTELIISMTSMIQIPRGTIIQFQIPKTQIGPENLNFYINSNLLIYSKVDWFYNLNLEQDYPSNFPFTFRIENIYTKYSQIEHIILKIFTFYNQKQIGMYQFFEYNPHINLSEPNIIQLNGQTLITDEVNKINFVIQPRFKYPLNSELIIAFPTLQSFDQISKINLVPISNINPTYTLGFSGNGIIVKSFNLKDDQSIIKFNLDFIRNPIGLQSLDIDITVQESTKSQMEHSLQSLLIQPSLISNLQINVQNSTIFAKTKIIMNFQIQGRQSINSVIKLIMPNQIQILQDSIIITQIQQETISVINQDIIISEYFLLDQNVKDVQIQIYGILSNSVCITDTIQLFTYDPNTNVKISEFKGKQSITINESTFSLISFIPSDLVTNYQTTYTILFQIPEIKQDSLFELNLPTYYAEQLSLCSAIIDDQACFCNIISQGVINIIINKGGLLKINLQNIRTERSVKQYQYTLNAIIYNTGIIHSRLLNGQFEIALKTPQTFYDYQLTISNLYYGKVAQYAFEFNVHSIIYNTDILKINIPQSITQILECNLDIIQQGNSWFTVSVVEGFNNIQCDLINPLNDDPIFPFHFTIYSQEGYFVAAYQDIFGIQDHLISNSLDFSIIQSSYYLNDLTNLSINYESSFGVQRFGSLSLLIDSTIYIPNNLQCFDVLQKNQQLLQTMECESQVNETQTTISSTAKNTITIGKNSLIFTGLQLGSLYTGLFNAKFALLNINQFGTIIESNSIYQNIQLKCMEKCLECSNYFNNCTKCQDNYVLYGQICLSQCPSGMIVSKEKRCVSCMTDVRCNLCNSEDVTKCITCNQGYDLIDGFCIRQQTIIQQNSTVNNTQNNNQSSINQDSMLIPPTITEFYDGIPFIIIVLAVFLILTFTQKIIQQTKAIKQFYLYASLIDFPVIILRLIRFIMIQDQVYSYLSTSCVSIALLTQISNSFHLQFSINKKKSEILYQGFKAQLMLLYSWRIIITYPLIEQIELIFKKMIKVQLMSHVVPIVIMLSYMIQKNHFYLFAMDDIIYNVVMVILQLTHQKWLTSATNQIHPQNQTSDKKYSNISVEAIRETS